MSALQRIAPLVRPRLLFSPVRTFADDEVAVEGELQLRVARQVALHLDAAVDGGVDDVPTARKEHVQALQDVYENLVLLLAAGLRCKGRSGESKCCVSKCIAPTPLIAVEPPLPYQR